MASIPTPLSSRTPRRPATPGPAPELPQLDNVATFVEPKPWEAIPTPPAGPDGEHTDLLLHPVTKELPVETLIKLGTKYGDMVRYRLMGNETVLVSSADSVQDILQSPKWWDRTQLPYFGYAYSRITGKPNTYGIVMRVGDDWKLHRRIANQTLLSPRVVDSFAPVLNRYSNEVLVKKWKEAGNGNPVVVNNDLTNYTASVILSVGLGEDVVGANSSLREELVSSVGTFFTGFYEMGWIPLPYPETPLKLKLDEAIDHLRDTCIGLLARKKAEIVQQGGVDRILASGKSVDFLTLLATTADEVTGKTISDTDAIADLLDIMNGGTDTTTALICFGMYLLAKHPEIQEEVYREVVSVVGKDKPIDAANLAKMKFLAHNIKEMQRVYPSAPINGRKATEDTVVGGYHVPKGKLALLNTWKIHMDPRYFKNPEKYDPWRWNEKHHPFAWGPFGHGARSCVGMRLSLMESKIAIANLVRAFRIEYREKEAPEHIWSITLRPKNPVTFHLHHRD